LHTVLVAAFAITCHLNLGALLVLGSTLRPCRFLFLFSLTVSFIVLAGWLVVYVLLLAAFLPFILLQEVLAESFFGLLGREHRFELTDSLSYFGFVGRIVQKCAAKDAAKVLEDGNREVAVKIAAIRRPAKSCLEREAVDQVEFTPHDYTCGRLTGLLNYEVTTVEAKVLSVPCEKKRENSLFEPIGFLIRAAVHEQILGARVAVVVTVKKDVTRVLSLLHHHFC
jgi:hypothetical protein